MSDQNQSAISGGGNEDDVRVRVEKAGDLFEQYGTEIRAMIGFHVRDKANADDIFQDFFVSIVKKPIPTETKDVRAYLFRVVSNDVIDRFRQKGNRLEKTKIYAERHKGRVLEKDPQNVVIQAEEVANIFRLVDCRLPRREARAVIQRYGLGLVASETTAQLRVEKRSVARYLTEAMRKIRVLVSQDGGGSG